MKALSGYAEWFWLIGKNIKDVENRPWPLSRYFKPEELPARFYLHGSKTKASYEEVEFILANLQPDEAYEFKHVNWGLLRGSIIGEATAVDEIGIGHIRTAPSSPWLFGPCAFKVRDGILYDKPIPMRGQLGFFEVKELVEKLTCFICHHTDTRDKFAYFWRYYEHKNVPCCRDEKACKERK
jgi:hypothetical protein